MKNLLMLSVFFGFISLSQLSAASTSRCNFGTNVNASDIGLCMAIEVSAEELGYYENGLFVSTPETCPSLRVASGSALIIISTALKQYQHRIESWDEYVRNDFLSALKIGMEQIKTATNLCKRTSPTEKIKSFIRTTYDHFQNAVWITTSNKKYQNPMYH